MIYKQRYGWHKDVFILSNVSTINAFVNEIVFYGMGTVVDLCTWECCPQTWHNWKIQHWVSSDGGYWREEGQGSIRGALQMKCVQKVTYTIRQRCRHFVRADSCWNNGVLCHTNQGLTGRGLGGRGQRGQIALAMSTKQSWTADPESSTRSQSSMAERSCHTPSQSFMAERSCHMVDLFGKKTKLFIWDGVWFQTIGDQKRPEKNILVNTNRTVCPHRLPQQNKNFRQRACGWSLRR